MWKQSIKCLNSLHISNTGRVAHGKSFRCLILNLETRIQNDLSDGNRLTPDRSETVASRSA
jgi:hypothetical protein